MSMPGDGLQWQDGQSLWGAELTKAVLNSSVPIERLDDMAMRIVAAWYQAGQDVHSEWPTVEEGGGPNFSSWTNDDEGKLHPGSPDSDQKGVVNKHVPVRQTDEDGDHDTLARRIAAEGIVLVKNEDSFLPLSRDGEGLETPKSGTGKIKVGIFGEDAFPNPDGINTCEDRSCNQGTLTMGWGSGAVDLPHLVPPFMALDTNFDSNKFVLDFWPENQKAGVENRAAEQDLCFVFINSDAGEGYLSWEGVKGDRNDLSAQKGGDELVEKVAQNCEQTIVVVHTVGPIIMERWIDLPSVKAVLIAHLPGQESGNSLVEIVFGDVNPSGRLPYTIARKEDDYGPTSKILYYPNGVVPQQNFTEGLYFDYRYFDKHDIEPRYEFGYGLSYTNWKLNSLMVHPHGISEAEPRPRPTGLEPPKLDSNPPRQREALWPSGLKKLTKYVYPYLDSTSDVQRGAYPYPDGYNTPRSLSPAGGGEGGNPDLYQIAVNIRASLSNVGTKEGSCVVQLYIQYPDNVRDADGEVVDMPVKVLRNFDKIFIDSGEALEHRKEVNMDLTRKDLSYWDVKRQNWVLPQGEFTVYLGFSSRDLPLSSKFTTTMLNFGNVITTADNGTDGSR